MEVQSLWRNDFQREGGFMRRTGECEKCGEFGYITKHHIFPKKFYGRGPANNNRIILLCRECHDEVEKFIPIGRRSKRWYIVINKLWLRGAI